MCEICGGFCSFSKFSRQFTNLHVVGMCFVRLIVFLFICLLCFILCFMCLFVDCKMALLRAISSDVTVCDAYEALKAPGAIFAAITPSAVEVFL